MPTEIWLELLWSDIDNCDDVGCYEVVYSETCDLQGDYVMLIFYLCMDRLFGDVWEELRIYKLVRWYGTKT